MKSPEMGWQQSQPEAAPEKFEEKSVKNEEGVLNRFLRGKAGKFARTLAFVTALSFGGGMAGTAKEAFADEKEIPKTADTMKENSPEQKDVEFFKQLYNLPDNPNAVNPAQNEILKGWAARAMIQNYVLQKMGIKSGVVKLEDLKKVIDDLNNISGKAAKEIYNTDDEFEGINKLNQDISKKAGIKTLMEMQIQYSK